MPIWPMYQEVAAIVLRVTARQGFALAGANALISHGFLSRPTHGVDLVTDQEGKVERADVLAVEALTSAGFTVWPAEPEQTVSTLGALSPGPADEHVCWQVIAPYGRRRGLMRLAYTARGAAPAARDFGPVLHPEDAAGAVVCSIALRRSPEGRLYGKRTDYRDGAALLGRWSAAELAVFARRIAPALTDDDLAAAGRKLDSWPDSIFSWPEPVSPADVAALRRRFAGWPR
jgi:hypothetical protein